MKANLPANRLLAALPAADYQRVLPSLIPVPLKFKQVLYKAGEKIDTVYFPNGGVCSVTNVMSDGRMVEVATIGNEGLVGMMVFLGGDVSVGDTFVQAQAEAQSMSVVAFRHELDRRGALHEVVGRYAQALHSLIMQSAACFGMHSVEERCRRWLLMTHDRVGQDEFPMTHEFLSYMLGARRPTVSLVLGTLEKAGVIHNGIKKITVVNRKGMEGKPSIDSCRSNVLNTF